jgi:PAS domain S-box-containing protein
MTPPPREDPRIKSQKNLELIVQTGLLLAKCLDLESLVQAATDAGLQMSGAQFGAFFYNVIDRSGESYLLYTLSGVDRSKFANFPMPRNTAVFGPTFEGTSVVRSGDITKDPRYGKNAPFNGMPKGHLPVCSYLAVPVKAQNGEVLGGLFYGHSNTNVFEPEAEELVGTIASQAAVAIENFRLREQLSRKVEALQAAEQEQRRVSKNLGELAAIVQSSDDSIITKDLNGTITSWNDAAARLFGYTTDEIIGHPIYRLIPEELHPEEVLILQRIRAGNRIEHFETIRVKKNGERFDAALTISPVRDNEGTIVGASKILRDISQRRKIDASLLQAEKISALGRMAATVAHEINNPLESVINLIYLARKHAGPDAKLDRYLLTAENELERVSQIARQTLGYYREVGSPVEITMPQLMENVLSVYRSKMAATQINIQMNFAANSPIRVNKGEMLQIFSNIFANAIDAMPRGGRLLVSTQESVRNSQPGVLASIADTGKGIPVENLKRIFDPFFTTKGMVGTGLGLWVAKQLAEKRGGYISISSSVDTLDSGTTAEIFIPFLWPSESTQSGNDALSEKGSPHV